ncbi:MAG: SDR family oxidoreductase [Dehalococcoidia bacterium]|nr:SDR family oxidoreductase [Dehalococcoidia bacterium]
MDESIGALLALDGQVAIVTGAATGIGEGIAHVLARAGAAVVVADLDMKGARRVAEAIGAQGGRARAVEADLSDLAGAEAAVGAAVEAFGGLDILVNNAGSYQGSGSIHDITPEMWRKLRAANLDTVFACAKAASRQMVAQGRGGAIVNITSVDGVHPFLGVNYDTFKAGANFFTQTLALDLAPHGIRVNAIAPGLVLVETLDRVRRGELPPITVPPSVPSGLRGPLSGSRGQHIPLGRAGTSEEIGQAVLFLCSSAASYVTGQILAVDGGWLLL